MWITKAEYARLVAEAAKTAPLQAQLAAHATTVDWLRVRVNQLEQQNATLFQAVTKLPVNVPMIRPTDPLQATAAPAIDPRQDIAALFEDVGDEQARALGIDLDDDGRVVYRK